MKKPIVFLAVFLLLAGGVLADTQVRRPSGDNSQTGTWTVFPAAPATYYDKVQEVVADEDATYVSATAIGRNLFNFTAFSVPAGAAIQNVTVYYRHRKAAVPACNIRSALKVGGNNYDTVDGGVNPTNGTYNTTAFIYGSNPKTGLSWTVNDVNGVGLNALEAFGLYSSDATPNPRVTQVSAEVTYTPNSPPFGGYTADNLIPAAQCVQSTSGDGLVTISFRVKDANLNSCSLNTFQYSTDGGTSWAAPANGDATSALSAGWTDNSGARYTSAADFTGPVYSFTFNTKHADVTGFNGVDQSDVRVRFTVNDLYDNSATPATSDNFVVDDLNPATLTATDISSRPNAGDTTAQLDSSFTEAHPSTNTFSLAINGGAYGAGTAGDPGTADPAAQATAAGATLDGNDYISKVKCVHADAYGNSATNEKLDPGNSGVKPYTPAPPIVGDPTASSVTVVVNKNASETDGLEYAIFVSSHSQYVQANGTLGGSAVWQTIANWGTKTVTGLSAPVSNYYFKTKSRNPNGDQPESDLSGAVSSGNSPPLPHNGAAEYVLPALSQATDGSGQISIAFKIKDLDLNNCSVVAGSVQFQVNSLGWNNILDLDVTGTKSGLSSAADLSGTTHTIVWDNSKEYIDNDVSQNVQIKFKVNDGTADSLDGVSPAVGFNIDNLDPATLAPANLASQPQAGDTAVTLTASFTETNPNTNTFYLAQNGGDYGSGAAGESNTATPAPLAVTVGKLDGSNYINKVKCVHVDDLGNTGVNENTAPDTGKKYVRPYTPATPTVLEATAASADVTINKNPSEATGLEYAVYVSSHNKYVQSDGTLGDSAVWKTIPLWGVPLTVSGLTAPVSSYIFKVKSRNSADPDHLPSSDSELSDGANSSGVPATPEAVDFYSPGAGAQNVSAETQVIIGFNRSMNQTSVQNSFALKAVADNRGNPLSANIAGTFSWTDFTVVTFTPAAALSRGYTYRVSLSPEATDFQGNALGTELVWTFRTVMSRDIQNTFTSSDGRARVELSGDALANINSINIDRDPETTPKEVDPGAITAANAKIAAKGDPFLHPLTYSITEFNAYGTDDTHLTGPFLAPVTVYLYYSDEDNSGIVDGTNPAVMARALWLYRLDETNGLWVKMPNITVDTVNHYVAATVPHFSVYTLMATPASSLTTAYAFPNPFKPGAGHTQVIFTNLSAQCTIKIFTLTGDLVRTIPVTDGTGQAGWDVKNDSGEDVASGLYLYVIANSAEVKRGKLAVIR
ncbi:MAG: Ig-like domain-containing protein [Candidatus Margulisbacteria bacterium]|jgi:hypothetical protein|nr:Ig-like domain-containing protein [Candidatus Margulisiibacteriota bacterium]